MTAYRFTAVVERDEEGLFIATCPVLQGCYTQGDTYEEALENLKDAVQLHIETRKATGEPIPAEVGTSQLEVVV